MMKILTNKKFIIFLGLVTLVIFITSLFYKPTPPLPEVTQSVPTPNATKVNHFDTINLQFNQTIDPSLISVSSTPQEEWIVSSTDKDTISLKPKQYFHVDTTYVVNVSYSQQLVYSLNFKTAHQQSDPRYAQEVVSEIKRDYPLAVKTPYETDNYSVIYSTPLTLEITLKNNNLGPSDIIAEVKAWVTKNGGDPIAHKYVIAP